MFKKLDDIEAYYISNEGEWAYFYVRHGKSNYGNNWITVTINSSFETFSYQWGHIGDRSWKQFLHNPDNMDYIMGKFLMGTEHTRNFDFYKSIDNIKSIILEDRKNKLLSKKEVRFIYEWLSEMDSCSLDLFLHQLYEIPYFSDTEVYELIVEDFSPWVKNFWDTLWVPWTTHMVTK